MSDKPTIDSVLANLEARLYEQADAEDKRVSQIEECAPLINSEEARRLMAVEATFRRGNIRGLLNARRHIDKLRSTPATFFGERDDGT